MKSSEVLRHRISPRPWRRPILQNPVLKDANSMPGADIQDGFHGGRLEPLSLGAETTQLHRSYPEPGAKESADARKTYKTAARNGHSSRAARPGRHASRCARHEEPSQRRVGRPPSIRWASSPNR